MFHSLPAEKGEMNMQGAGGRWKMEINGNQDRKWKSAS